MKRSNTYLLYTADMRILLSNKSRLNMPELDPYLVNTVSVWIGKNHI